MAGLFKNLVSENEARAVGNVLKDVVGGVKNVSDEQLKSYLEKKIGSYLPEKSYEEVSSNVDEILKTIQRNNENLMELDEAKEKGINREAWFAEKTQSILENASREVAVQFYDVCSEVLQQANEQLYNAVTGTDFYSGKSSGDTVIETNAYEIKDVPDLPAEKWDEKSWNEYKLKDLAMGVGKQAANNAVMKAAMTAGTEIIDKIISGEDIDVSEVVEKAVSTGTDTGMKAAVAGSLLIASEKNMLRILPKGTPLSTISNIAFTVVENIKIAFKVATGKMTVTEGLSRTGDVTVASLAGMAADALSTGVKAIATTVFGPVGAVVSNVVSSAVSGLSGSKVGKTISEGVKKVATGAVNVVKSAGRAFVSAGSKVVNEVKSTAKKIWNSIFG